MSQFFSVLSRWATMMVRRPRMRASLVLVGTCKFPAMEMGPENGAIAQKCAGQRDALALSARELRAAFSHFAFVAFGQAGNEFVTVGGLGGGHDLCIGGIRLTVGDIFRNAGGKQQRVLQDNGELPAQIGNAIFPDVTPIEQHLPAAGIVKTHQQIEDRCLAGAAVADNSHPRAWRQAE